VRNARQAGPEQKTCGANTGDNNATKNQNLAEIPQ
jgi:hypothetical protein